MRQLGGRSITQDEESSGVIPAPFLGKGKYLIDVQNHKPNSILSSSKVDSYSCYKSPRMARPPADHSGANQRVELPAKEIEAVNSCPRLLFEWLMLERSQIRVGGWQVPCLVLEPQGNVRSQ